MLIDVVHWLRESGLEVERQNMHATPGQSSDAVLLVRSGNAGIQFAVETKQRAPYLNELASLSKLRESASALGVPLLVAPFITESTGTP